MCSVAGNHLRMSIILSARDWLVTHDSIDIDSRQDLSSILERHGVPKYHGWMFLMNENFHAGSCKWCSVEIKEAMDVCIGQELRMEATCLKQV
jgi:hypothetical protein